MTPMFMAPSSVQGGYEIGPSHPIYSRSAVLTPEQLQLIERVNRGDIGTDVNATLTQLTQMMANVSRAVTSGMTAFPVRENLEAEAKSLVPRDTPMRNRIRRKPGAGLAGKWKQITSYGGGYGASTTVATTAVVAGDTTVVTASAAGLRVGDFVQIGTGATIEVKQITAINVNTITVSAMANAQPVGRAVVKVTFQPGGGAATRTFFQESGAPADFTSVYADKSASYKLMGLGGSVTGFAMAAGANFQNQLATEKTNCILNTMLNEENALLNGDATSALAPWGDGATAMAFDGLLVLTSTANGVPADQIQVSVGQLTTDFLDKMLTRLYYRGARGMYMIMSGQEITSLAKIATGGSNNYRIMLNPAAATIGTAVTGYLHPITGEVVDIIPSRFISPGTVEFGADYLPDGNPALEVEVLPQVELPTLAPNESVQGYVAQELAPAKDSPQVHPFIVTVFEVLKMKGATVFAKGTGLTPA